MLSKRVRRLGLILGLGLMALAASASSAFAATSITLHNPGTTACTADSTSFHFVLTSVSNSAALASTQISVTFVTSGSTTPTYTVSFDSPVVNNQQVSWTITQSQLLSLLQSAYPGANFTLAAVQNLQVSGGSITLPTGVTANNFVLSSCPLPSGPGGNIPEVPVAILYPLLGALTLGIGYGMRRLRRRGSGLAAA